MTRKRYTYFFSAVLNGRVGNGEVWTEGGPVESFDHVRDMEASIARKTGYDSVTITNYILLRVEKLP